MPLPLLPRSWLLFDLPGYRDDGQMHTYREFPLAELPPIERNLDPDFKWLRDQPLPPEYGLTSDDRVAPQIVAARREAIAAEVPSLPSSFLAFISDLSLPARIASATACYLDLGDRVVPVKGGGSLVHFLSDQQWCLHWLLYVAENGSDCVVATYPPYGFELDDADAYADEDRPPNLDVFDPEASRAWVSAESFSEFIYRFWLENDIWFRLTDDRPLTAEQERYLSHYDAT